MKASPRVSIRGRSGARRGAPPRGRFPLSAVAIAIAASLPAIAGAAEPTATVVEFYNSKLNHYFITAYADEAAMLDAGALVPGWTRTGATWSAWAGAADTSGTLPVYRFFGTPGVGPNSHFYTADPAERAVLATNPNWTFEGIAFYIALPANGACGAGTTPVYRSFYPGAVVSESNHRFLTDLTMHEKMASSSILEGVAMCAALSSREIESDAVRLLEQATFGPTDAAIEHVKAVGAAAFIDEQLALPPTRYTAFAAVPTNNPGTCVDDRTLPIRPDSFCNRDNYTLFQLQREFVRDALADSDQLRLRVAFALSQILVTSGTEINLAYAMGRYQQMLIDLAFDNFEKVLTQVTLSPVMGAYLDMANNVKPNATTGVQPNENYAREILQLFSIGLYELNSDGSLLLDANRAPIPTYGQNEILNFAHVFTGWTYPTTPGIASRTQNPKYYDGGMEERSTNHDTSAKTLLDGAAAPANLTMSADLANAIHVIASHPNVGPFIGKQLIQKLVTGNPTPQYVARVAAAFNNNGAGVRGDLRAVVRAILLDPEARGASKLDATYGHLREPVKLVTATARALNAASDGVFFRGQPATMLQNIYTSPTVFNYYPPDYLIPGTSTLGPEFAIQNTQTSFARINYLNTLAFTATFAPDATVYGATGTQLDFSALTAVAADANALVAKLDRLMMHNSMSAAMKAAIVAAVNAAGTDALTRARTAFYLVASSSQYQVER